MRITVAFSKKRPHFEDTGPHLGKTAAFDEKRLNFEDTGPHFEKKTAAFCKIQGRILLIEQIGVARIFRNPNPGTKSQKTWKIPGKWARAFSRSLHIKNFSPAFGARQFQ